ncbi:hypothetical protein V1478_012130 [Vespula squamosa]|uniref:Uncharacterized protein n=1 Tax=Vespula squamosa TaxID=30214 RepID=A0ABD2ACB9_VESSQ
MPPAANGSSRSSAASTLSASLCTMVATATKRDFRKSENYLSPAEHECLATMHPEYSTIR